LYEGLYEALGDKVLSSRNPQVLQALEGRLTGLREEGCVRRLH
jgi:hypothetical protein